jgi:two-component system, NarL family, sensor histidine kinase UhpB
MNDPVSPGRILIVDDNADIHRVVRRILLGHGHAVDCASSVAAALAAIAERPYDVAIVDLDMPERDGIELIDAIVAHRHDLLAVMLTGTTDVAMAVAGMKRGAFDFLGKPCDPDTIRWTVNRALETIRARRRERALRTIVEEWTATFDATPNIVLLLDLEGTILRANRAALGATGLQAVELVGRNVSAALSGEFARTILEGAERVSGGRPAYSRRIYDLAIGKHLVVGVSSIRSSAGLEFGRIVTARDVSEIVRVEASREKVYRQLLAVQESERRRLARELHDGIAQSLVSLAVGLSHCSELATGDELRARIEDLGQLATGALGEIRQLVHGLRPPVLDDIGLVEALQRLTESFTKHDRVRAELLLPSPIPVRLSAAIESAIYRIVQEALANVAKHARAKTVDVVLEVNDRIHLSIADDGRGFVHDGTGDGIGLSTMRERAEMLMGTFRLESRPGGGTTITIDVPLRDGTS